MGAGVARRRLSDSLADSGGVGRALSRRRHGLLEQGDLATIEHAGQRYVDCRSNPAKVPWADAARRGATFRALGNEPSWYVEILPDRLAIVTELGANRAELPHGGPVVADGRTTYRAAAMAARRPSSSTGGRAPTACPAKGSKPWRPSASRIERCSAAGGFFERGCAAPNSTSERARASLDPLGRWPILPCHDCL